MTIQPISLHHYSIDYNMPNLKRTISPIPYPLSPDPYYP